MRGFSKLTCPNTVQENLDYLSKVQIGLGLFLDFQKFGLRFTPLVSIVSNTASSDLHQKIASFMEIYWHYLWTLSRVHGSHYGTCSKCLYFLATPHCSASDLLGHTFSWVNRANDRKDRLFQSSQGFWCPLVHNTLQVPHKKNPERWNPANMVVSSRRRKRQKKTPLETVLQPGRVIAGCSCVSRWPIFLKRLLVECASALWI